MRILFSRAVVLLFAEVFSSNAVASVLYESSSLGQTGITWEQGINQEVPGSNVAGFNFDGVRFHVSQSSLATKIGGHFVGGFDDRSFFGAIVKLTGATDFPDSGK